MAANSGYPETTPSTLATPRGGISYHALYSRNYVEQWMTDANQITIHLTTAWATREDFHYYALGYTTGPDSNSNLVRRTPLACPFNKKLYLSSLKKVDMGVGMGADGSTFTPDPTSSNWFKIPNGWIVYEATFTNRPYEVMDQSDFTNAFTLSTSPRTQYTIPVISGELQRYVTREVEARPKERKAPSFGFETDDAAASPIPEVGFIPFYEYEFTYTWYQIPWQLIPWGAIENLFLRVNTAMFDGQYPAGSVLFKGLGGKIRPYRGPDNMQYADIPFIFGYQPGDGTGNGWNKLPRADGSWVLIRAVGTGGATGKPAKPLYLPFDFTPIFRPDVPVTVMGSPPASSYKAPQAVTVRAKVNPYLMLAPFTYSWTGATAGSDTSYATQTFVAPASSVSISVLVTDSRGVKATGSITYTIV